MKLPETGATMVATSATKERFPGGFYLAFPWSIDRASSGRLVEAVGYAHGDGYETVNVLLSSTGGLLADAHYAVECLAAMPVQLIMWNMSAVQSAANMLFALGVERYATPGSWFGFHQTGFAGVAGERVSETEIKEQLRQIGIGDRRSAAFIAERVSIAPEIVSEWQTSNKTLTEVEAKAAGFIHDVRRPQIPRDALMRHVLPTYS